MSQQLGIEQYRPDPARPREGWFHHDGPDTERIAARRHMPRAGTQRAKVLAYLRTVGDAGATDNEMHFVGGIGARPHVPGSRRLELIDDGWPIVDSGKRRRTDTGDPAIVWVLLET